MPRENKKRGRREHQKRKHDYDHDHEEVSPKRQRMSEDHSMPDVELEVDGDAGDDYIGFGFDKDGAVTNEPQNQFYGLLEPDEQEYYANVNNKISANDFESDEDRALFIEAVHRETQGKEMKVASSQSCSRYLEKIIALSAADQLKSLFSAFLEDLTYLVQHRFGSHCCETLFLQAAKFVGLSKGDSHQSDSLESLYVQAVEKLEPNIGFLLTERFASHTIRVLLLVLSGEPLDDDSTKSMLASQRKESIDLTAAKEDSIQRRKVPDAFNVALQRFVTAILSSIDTTYLRALATHPVGNPVLQLLLKLELAGTNKTKHKVEQSLLTKLIPDVEMEAESDSGKFIVGLIYDPTGSHLIEALVQYLPGKSFKKLYKNILKERMRNLSKNDIASYVAIRVLERLGKDDLADTSNEIINEIPGLVTRSRIGILRVLFERCGVRHVDTKRLADAVRNAYGADDVTFLPKMLRFQSSIEDLTHNATSEQQDHISPFKADIHGSLLAQTMLKIPVACHPVQQSILAQPISSLMAMANNPTASRVLQAALTSSESATQFRRQLVPHFYTHLASLARSPAGSHVVDALWHGTNSLHFMKEKLAKELQENEAVLRDSTYGRTVWRNWNMDTYTRRFNEWQDLAKGRAQETPQEAGNETKKTAIELARERHAVKRTRMASDNAKP